jgi:hypothetical protein
MVSTRLNDVSDHFRGGLNPSAFGLNSEPRRCKRDSDFQSAVVAAGIERVTRAQYRNSRGRANDA